jgi:hypothetical protein
MVYNNDDQVEDDGQSEFSTKYDSKEEVDHNMSEVLTRSNN